MPLERPERVVESDLYEWTLGIWKDEKDTPESSEDVFNGLPSDSSWD